MLKRKTRNISIPLTLDHGYFFLLGPNVIPYAATKDNKVLFTISKHGRGRIGFVASNRYSKRHIEDYCKEVYDTRFIPQSLTPKRIENIYSGLKNKTDVYSIFYWEVRHRVEPEEVKMLLELVTHGLNIIICINPWQYHKRFGTPLGGELELIYHAAGIWPSLEVLNENITILQILEIKHFPLVHLLDYAAISLSNTMDVCHLIIYIITTCPLNNLFKNNIFTYLSSSIRELFDILSLRARYLIPCLAKPLRNKGGKNLIHLLNYILLQPYGNTFIAPGLSFYPGKLDFKNIKNNKFAMKLNLKFSNEITQLGLYIPPNRIITVHIGESKRKPCIIYVNRHLFNTNGSFEWTKWPITDTEFLLNERTLRLSSPFGGLLSISCLDDDIAFHISFSGVFQIPIYDRRDKNSKMTWHSLQKSNSPWSIIAGDSVVFVVPSHAIRNMAKPNKILKLYDTMIKSQLHVKGVTVTKKRREFISIDIQTRLRWHDLGYPIGVSTALIAFPTVSPSFLFNLKAIRKNASWYILSEIGYNLLEDIWTFDLSYKVNSAVFALIGTESMIGETSWNLSKGWIRDTGAMSMFIPYIKNGAFSDWRYNWVLALGIYAQIRAHFTWELYAQVYRKFKSLWKDPQSLESRTKMNMWIERTSYVAGMNLCPIFDLWRWPITEETKKNLSHFPPFMPNDFLTKLVSDRVNEIIIIYGGYSKVIRKPLKVPVVVGPLNQKSSIEGGPTITDILFLN